MMNTKLVKIDELHMDEAAIAEAGRVLAEGGLVAFPTETVYGLGPMAFVRRQLPRSMRRRDVLRTIR